MSRLEKNRKENPTAIIASAAFVILNATICAVMVVPMFAPMITPIDWEKDINPAVVKPTTSTVVTDEDWIIAVTNAPVSAPVNRLEVSFARTSFIRSPATAFRAAVIWSIPNRNRARPPRSSIVIGPAAIAVADAATAPAGRRHTSVAMDRSARRCFGSCGIELKRRQPAFRVLLFVFFALTTVTGAGQS